MAFAGRVGVQIDLKAGSIAAALFRESNTRFLVEVVASSEAAFNKLLAGVTLEAWGNIAGEELSITSSRAAAYCEPT
ncbi:MAG: hypothetical protein U0936_00225 [Planctomycetaceae bacterium]